MIDSPEPSADTAVSVEMLPLELSILDHYARRSRGLLYSLPAILGRDEKDDVRLADPWISHSHCELFQHGAALMVRDLDSKNGVFMHGLRVRETEVLPGDCITLGRTEITLRFGHATAGDAAASSASAAGEGAPAPSSPAAGPRRPVAGGPMTEELLY